MTDATSICPNKRLSLWPAPFNPLLGLCYRLGIFGESLIVAAVGLFCW